jgi:hypothetical protein
LFFFKVDSLQASFNTKLDSLQAHARTQALQWALSGKNNILVQFSYMTGTDYYRSSKSSEQLICDILRYSLRGEGFCLSNDFCCDITGSSRPSAQQMLQQFRDNLSNALHELTGIKPTMWKTSDGRWAVRLG